MHLPRLLRASQFRVAATALDKSQTGSGGSPSWGLDGQERPPPQPTAVTSVSAPAQPAYIPQLPLGTPSEEALLAPQPQTLTQQQPSPQQQPSAPNPRKRKAADTAPTLGMPSASLSGYAPSGGYAAQPGEQPADVPTQGSTPKKSRTNTPWSPAEEQRLKIMRDAGNSWSEIAKVRTAREHEWHVADMDCLQDISKPYRRKREKALV
ncbi:MAG: hypothetical protein Q9170_003165 [Blastenia crenularia]